MTQRNYRESPLKDELGSEQASQNGGAPDAVERQREPRGVKPWPPSKPPSDG